MTPPAAVGQLGGTTDDGPPARPGTGDASLTLAQAVPLTGVAIVCTPQDVATDIAIKALQMFRKLNVTPLGLIENMSWYICPSCGHRHEIFSHGGAESAAKRLGVPFLGAIPLGALLAVIGFEWHPLSCSEAAKG